MMIKLSDIFIAPPHMLHYTKQELLALTINENFFDEIARRLDLTYLENGSKEANLCFVNDEQLRPEYKMFFSKSDVIDYLNYVLESDNFNIKTDELPFPEIGDFFINQ